MTTSTPVKSTVTLHSQSPMELRCSPSRRPSPSSDARRSLCRSTPSRQASAWRTGSVGGQAAQSRHPLLLQECAAVGARSGALSSEPPLLERLPRHWHAPAPIRPRGHRAAVELWCLPRGALKVGLRPLHKTLLRRRQRTQSQGSAAGKWMWRRCSLLSVGRKVHPDPPAPLSPLSVRKPAAFPDFRGRAVKRTLPPARSSTASHGSVH
mmetsp:Transcript_74388/g.240491  ORF Transcript_74388/g.240491 Transcript_74388/m.240491 type:complete len:209 (+) Transcript_74388:455-1081(+)